MNYVGELDKDKEVIDNNSKILIYGAGGYGEKIYRNLAFYRKQENVIAFIDKDILKQSNFHNIPVISVERAIEEHQETIVCIGGDVVENIRELEQIKKMKNIHQIVFDMNCKLYGTEYGGFYLPNNLKLENSIVYSFGIGEDLSFSEAVIEAGGIIYAFDPTSKAIKYVKNHRLLSHSNFHFYPYGLSDKDGKENFYLPKRNDYVSGSVILHRNVDEGKVVEAEMKTIRSIMKEFGHDHIDILKMDIEGSEFKVVKDLMNPELKAIDFKACLLETHERFFAPKDRDYVDQLYGNMRENGYVDLYGTAREPTFVKI